MNQISDYIKPGEFSFCPRCGEKKSCMMGSVPRNCLSCGPIDIKLTFQQKEEEDKKDRIGLQLYELRKRIAMRRKKAGMKPIFWMK
jgi:hypothetical protein